MTARLAQSDAIDRNARWELGLFVVSAVARGHRLGTDRRHRQG
jgi:hypothetical protein